MTEKFWEDNIFSRGELDKLIYLQFINQTLKNYFLDLAHVLECLYGVQQNSACTNCWLENYICTMGSIIG